MQTFSGPIPLDDTDRPFFYLRVVVIKARGELKKDSKVVEGGGKQPGPNPQDFCAQSTKSAGQLSEGASFAAGAATGVAVTGKESIYKHRRRRTG